jgi:hypothetical protein
MRFLETLTASLLLTGSSLCAGATGTAQKGHHGAIAPKVFIVSMVCAVSRKEMQHR